MKNSTFLKTLCLGFTSLLSLTEAHAQENITTLIKAGAADASTLTAAYIGPIAKGFGAGMNGGWYHTAKPHGLARFDVTLSINAANIPDADKDFDASKLVLQNLTLANNANNVAQTFAGISSIGSNNAVFQVNGTSPFTNTDTVFSSFGAPAGYKINNCYAPTVQLAVGLLKNTELMIRYCPTNNVANYGKIGLVGLGIKHSLKQWIPIVNKLPFDLSAYAGFTRLNISSNLSLLPDAFTNMKTGKSSSFDNQVFALTTTAQTYGVILSKKVLMVTVYAGLNYQASSTTIELNGDYPLTSFEDRLTDVNYGKKVIDVLTNPVNINVDGANGATATVGGRFKFLFLTVNASKTFGEYPLTSVGLGFNLDLK